ncbi:MAG TPA: YciI family protein [Candidatus Acidoferrales bacterium]|nr:YciI family protein [Candidatus Acidoferrales bacterium]
MRFMVIVKANKDSEAGIMPSRDLLEKMGAYNEDLAKAGILLAADGLHPSSKGARVKFLNGKHVVTEGPFPETEQLIAGFWIWRVKSKEEAIEWLKRAPFGGGVEIELRQVFETADFGDQLTPELREQEARVAAQAKQRSQAAKS